MAAGSRIEKTAIVTGGTRGIGAATTRALVTAGYTVCATYKSNAQAAQELAQELNAQSQCLEVVAVDVAEEAAVLGLFLHFESKYSHLDVLINNAGIVADAARVDEYSVERLELLFRTNVLGTILCCREAVRRMSTRHGGGGGCIVNLSSVASRLGAPGEYVDYAATKGAVDSFTLGFAKEVATENIRVNAVRPGIIETDIHASGGQPDRVQRLQNQIPMQRGGSAVEVAAAIMWLVGDGATYTTGALLDVAGGR